MKVDRPRPIETGAMRRAGRPGAVAPGFSVDLSQGTTAATPKAAASPLGAVDALLALQAVPDAVMQRSKAVRRGQVMLDLLDDLRDGMLAGQISRASVQRLSASLVRDDQFTEPGLQAVLDAIELRAHVELAKLEQR